MTPVRPATPRGSSDADASGFGDLLATALAEDDGAPRTTAGRATSRAEEATQGDQALVREDEAVTPEVLITAPPAAPTVLVPKGDTESGPQVLPGEFAPKGAEPLVLPGEAAAKADEPLLQPGTPVAKGGEPQVLPGTATAKGSDPLVLPGAATAKGSGPQILPGSGVGKGPQPQVLPGEEPLDAALPAGNGDTMQEAPSADLTSPSLQARPGAAPVPQPLPPLRPLAERTSKPLDDAAKALEATPPAEGKAGAPSTTPAMTQPEPPAKTAAASPAPLPAPATDALSAPAESGPAGEPPPAQAEAAAPVRDHTLSTLSRATIDATAQIAAQILRKLEGRSTRFEIALKPAELGRVDVKLDIDAEGRLAARLAFDNPAAATDLRGRADELRRQLEAAGFQLADDAFEFAERDSGSSAFDRGQDARHGQNRAFAAAARLKSEIDVAQPPQWLALSLSPSGVDMKV
ncbi:flagellar hook-length control protein FliK [Brevundimonas sp.]|uniref:flagellar hook-length control protein FliK n=1 Tax=Brevundimonas sp. TaxID=1871086 RepID=UPI002D6E53B4|nr:flagellar hook-length control protein FliK [Brevundimonas sp.]HYD27656.1 flagellar hook-length control protein FliK [Brevundimonas sp.]